MHTQTHNHMLAETYVIVSQRTYGFREFLGLSLHQRAIEVLAFTA